MSVKRSFLEALNSYQNLLRDFLSQGYSMIESKKYARDAYIHDVKIAKAEKK